MIGVSKVFLNTFQLWLWYFRFWILS